MVAIPTPLVVHFESGFNIAEIVKSILKRSGNNIPASLENVRKDASKNVKLTNWNFVWYYFFNSGYPLMIYECSLIRE